jgi:hypothetical protein
VICCKLVMERKRPMATITDANATPKRSQRLNLILGLAGGLVVLILMTHWGGAAQPGPLLYAGIGVLLGVVVVFAFLAWWLFFSPLPAGAKRLPAFASPLIKQTMVALTIVSGVMFFIGLFWDEMWHRQFGVPLGEDFFWRPHIMMYISMGLLAVFALGGTFRIMRGKGDLRQRFRAEPGVGLLALTSAFMMFCAPLDPLWHQIYGFDLTAWSLPHLLLFGGFGSVMLSTVLLQLSLMPRAEWRGLNGFGAGDLLNTLLIVCGLMLLSQLFTAEWEGLRVIGRGQATFWERPEWLYPVVMLGLGVFIGMFALHSTRLIGIATLVGLIALGFRYVLLLGLNAAQVDMTLQSQLTVLPVFVALDLVYWLHRAFADHPRARLIASLSAAGAMFLIGLPLIAQIMIYPRVNAETLPSMIVFGLIMAVLAGYGGASIGGAVRGLASGHAAPESAPMLQATRVRALRTGAVVLLAALVFVAWYIATAAPPLISGV